MFSAITAKIAAAVMSVAIGISSLLGHSPQQNIGATVPTVVALFETSLANGISASATSFTLVDATTKDGTTLAADQYGFVIDEGSANEEFVFADCTATACTNVRRGLSVIDGWTEVAGNKKAHRRGASVKITDHPQLAIISRVFQGLQGADDVMYYTSHPDFTALASTSIPDLAYVASVTYAGTVDAATDTKGNVEIATTAEINAGTSTGATGAYVVANPSFLALSSYSSQLLSENDEKFLANMFTYVATASYVQAPIMRVYTASTSWTKPAGLKYAVVEVVGGGGDGSAGGSDEGGSGGGGGGYAKELFTNSELVGTFKVVVASANGTSYFVNPASISATGGADGAANSIGGLGGSGVGGDLNLTGGGGAPGFNDSDQANEDGVGGNGGSSFMGGGGRAGYSDGSGGSAGGNYGGGGGGGGSASASGGAGAKGVVIITEYYF